MRSTYLSAMLLLCMVVPSSGQALGLHGQLCGSEARPSSSLDFQAMLEDPDVAQLLFLKEEVLSIVASADRSKLLESLQAGDLESFARVAGLSGSDIHSYRKTLQAISAKVLDRFPELGEFMPRAPIIDNPEMAAIVLQRLPSSGVLNDTLIMPFSSILKKVESSNVAIKQQSEAGSLLWSGGLTPPPSGPLDPCSDGAWAPDCGPGSDFPPPEHPELPGGGGDAPWDPEGGCQAGPYFAGMIGCALAPPGIDALCMYGVMCSFCEGGIFDTLCFAD